jgi:uncharacterized repeat protein (TIGR01451 family)
MGRTGRRERTLVVVLTVMMLVSGVPVAGWVAPSPVPMATTAPVQKWPMFAHDSAHTGAAPASARPVPTVGTKWDRNLFADSLATVVGNLTGNVRAVNRSRPFTGELHCSVVSIPGRVYALEGAEGRTAWELNITGSFSAAPAVGDLDGDGRSDIVLASFSGAVYAYEPIVLWNGTTFGWWGNNTQDEQLWNTTDATVGSVTASSVVLDDLGSNGMRVLVGSTNGVFCLDGSNGKELWNRSLSGASVATPAVYRIGTQRNVVAASLNTTPPSTLHMYTLRGTTGAVIKHLALPVSITPGTYVPPTVAFYPSPVAADLDGQADGDELVVVQPYYQSTGRVHVYSDGDLDASSETLNMSLGGTSALDHIAHATPAVADMDRDGGLDIVVVAWRPYKVPGGGNTYTNVTVIDGKTSAVIWARDIDETGPILDWEWGIASPMLCDLTGDRRPEVLVAQYNGRLTALHGTNGTRLWDIQTRGYPSATLTSSGAVGDFDLDGYADVVLNGQAFSVMLPDLTVETADVTFTDPTPDEGEVVGIDVLVHNRGNADARNVLVTVLDGEELAGNVTVTTVVAGGSYSARVTHQFYGRVDHTVAALLDPLDDIEELREDNNNATAGVRINSFWGVAVDCPNPEAIIGSGTTWHFFAEVRNVGRYHNRISVTAEGAPGSWTVGVTPAAFTLGPAGSSTDYVTVDVQVATDPTTPVGEYGIRLTATSLNETRDQDSVDLTVVIKGRWGVHLTPADSRRPVAPGDAVVYRFNATNIGNTADDIVVEATVPSPDPDWGVNDVNVFPLRIEDLAPDQGREVSLSVSAPFEATEGASLTVVLRVTSAGEPAQWDESTAITTVVLPDIAVVGLAYRRADGTDVDGTTKRLVIDEESTLVARLSNLKGNVGISNLRVRFTVDGTSHDVTVQDLPPDRVAEATFAVTFTTIGDHGVEAWADPYGIISDSDRGNNIATGRVAAKERAPVGPFDIEGLVLRPDNITPVPMATVRLTVESSGYTFTVTGDAGGLYTASLAETRYYDGDTLTIGATDGRDHGTRTLLVYSEDVAAEVDVVLVEGVHYDVSLATPDTAPMVDDGTTVRLPVTLRSLGNRGTTVDLLVTSQEWQCTLLDPTNVTVWQVTVVALGAVELVLEVVVPDDARGSTVENVSVRATSQEDPAIVAWLNATLTVRPRAGFTMAVTASPDGDAHPGDERSHVVTVRGTGNVDDVVDLSYDRAMEAWCVTFDQDPVAIGAFQVVVVRVTFTVPQGTGEGNYTVSVSGVSTVDASVVANAYIEERVVPVRRQVALSTLVASASARPGETASWSVDITNTGNVEDRFGLTVLGLPAAYTYAVMEGASIVTEVRLAVGASATLVVEVDVPATISERPQSTRLPLKLKAISRSDLTAFTGIELELVLEGILDLSIQVSVSTNTARVDGSVVFTVQVTNTGPANASRVAVWAYLDEVKPTKATIPLVSAQDTETTTIEWVPAKEGSVTIRIVLNPTGQNGTMFEYNRTNNEWSKTFSVQPSEGKGLLRNPLFWGIVIVLVIVVLLALYFFSGGREGDEGPGPKGQGGKGQGKGKGGREREPGTERQKGRGTGKDEAGGKDKGKGVGEGEAVPDGKAAGKDAAPAPAAKQVAGQAGAKPASPKGTAGAAPSRKGAPAQPTKGPTKKRPPKGGRPPEVDKNMFSGKM